MNLLCFFSVLHLLCLCTCLFLCALWSPAGKGLTSWLLFVVSNCEFVTFPLVSLVRCGTLLYRFLIFASLLSLMVTKSEAARASGLAFEARIVSLHTILSYLVGL